MTSEDEQYLEWLQGLPEHHVHVVKLLMRHAELKDVAALDMAKACESAREFFQALHDVGRTSRFDPGHE